MIDLKNEIEKVIKGLQNEYQRCFEDADCPISCSDIIQGKIQAYRDVERVLEDYNIITAPKSIKLSEVVKRLNLAFPAIIKEEKVIRIYNLKALILNIFDNHLQPINVQPCKETKWLYALWLTETEIIDDMVEKEE